MTVTRTGGVIDVVTDTIGRSGKTYHTEYHIDTAMDGSAPIYFLMTGEKVYLEILSIS